MIHLSRRRLRADGLFGRQILAGQLKMVVPQGIFAGTQLLMLIPAVDAFFGTNAAFALIEHEASLVRQVGAARRVIGQNHLVAVLAVFKVIINALVLHEPAGEGEVRFAVLHAVIARLIGTGQLTERDINTVEDGFEDVGYGLLLKDATAHALGP